MNNIDIQISRPLTAPCVSRAVLIFNKKYGQYISALPVVFIQYLIFVYRLSILYLYNWKYRTIDLGLPNRANASFTAFISDVVIHFFFLVF